MAHVFISAGVGLAALQADPTHPNKMNFRGVLVRLDEPSTKAPSGSRGHRILVPSDVAQRRLKTLIGMGLNYSASLDKHEQRRKVGTIQKAWIDGQDVYVEGTVWKRDFPETERDLKQPGLGMSMEIGEVSVEDENANIWKLTDFHFMGATILRKTAAAYLKTSAIAAQAEGRNNMAVAKRKATGSLAASFAKALVPLVTEIKSQGVQLRQMNAKIAHIASANDETAELDATGDEDEFDALFAADDEKKKPFPPSKTDDSLEEEDAPAEDEGDEDDEDVKAEGDDESDKPGELNKGATNRGSKTYSMNKVGPTINKGIAAAVKAGMADLQSQIAAMISPLAATVERQGKQIAVLAKAAKATKVQVEAAAAVTERRSATTLDPTAVSILQRGGINVADLQASGQKLQVHEVDDLLRGLNMNVTDRAALKNKLTHAGFMDEGFVQRAN
jgi:hypothetical protein